MKVLVTGGSGQLGSAVMARLEKLRIDALAPTSAEMDITDQQSVMDTVTAYMPDAIIHCAAWTDVDEAEKRIADCARVNGLGTIDIVRAAERVGAKLMYISTDYVFGDKQEGPLPVETYVAPLNIYGMTKGQGELAVKSMMKRYFIVRCSWIYSETKGFVTTIQRLAQGRGPLRVVDDQVGSPTYARDLAVLLCDMIRTEKYGVYGASAEGSCSWYTFAQRIVERSGLRCRVQPVSSEDYGARAHRPKESRLDKIALDRAGFVRLPDWQDGLERCLMAQREAEPVDK